MRVLERFELARGFLWGLGSRPRLQPRGASNYPRGWRDESGSWSTADGASRATHDLDHDGLGVFEQVVVLAKCSSQIRLFDKRALEEAPSCLVDDLLGTIDVLHQPFLTCALICRTTVTGSGVCSSRNRQ